MNLQHLKYAVEVARLGSINKASDVLFVGQPNLSRAIKDLEAHLGITIFDRSAKGMVPTPEGEDFLQYARGILRQVDEVEAIYRVGVPTKRRFSISVPRASYISEAFAQFSRSLDDDPAELFYMETNSSTAISNILQADYRLGIIRYADNHERNFAAMLDEKGLDHELVAEFHYMLLMSRKSPLASTSEISFSDLLPHIEVAHADPFVPSIPAVSTRKSEIPAAPTRRIYVFERGSQFDILSENPDTFMWVSPVPQKLLDRYGLIQRWCPDNSGLHRDVLIRRKEYKFTDLDSTFIAKLFEAKRTYLDSIQRS